MTAVTASFCLDAQIDMGQQRSVVGCGPDGGTIQNGCRDHAGRGRCHDTVQWQQGSVDRKRRLYRAAKILPQKTRGQRQPAPWTPFVQVTHQQGRLSWRAEHKLADRAQLRPAHRLGQRQMHADQSKRPPTARQIRHYRTAMTAPGQIKQGDVFNGDAISDKQDRAQKPVTAIRPAIARIMMGIAQTCSRLDTRDIKQSAMWGNLFIGFLQDQRVNRHAQAFRLQGRKGPGRVDMPVIAPAPVNIPAEAGKIVLIVAQMWPAFFSVSPATCCSVEPISKPSNNTEETNVCC